MRKLTLQDVQRLAESKDGKCLSTEYINACTKMLWKCNKCKHLWATKYYIIQGGTWCPECAINKSKNTLQDAQKLAEKRNGNCLSTEYINNRTKMLWECEKEHQWETEYRNIQQGSWCPECIKNTLQDVQKLAENKRGKCLSKKYTNTYTKMLWECEEEHQWKATFNSVQQGSWCSECIKITIQDVQRLAESKDGKCLSTEYINACTKMLWKCNKCKYQWKATYSNIQQDYWCPKCAGNAKNTLQGAQKLAENKKGKCLSTKYINCMTKMLWECEKEHQWETTYNNVRRDTWCPYCKTSKAQKQLSNILEKTIGEKPITIRPQWLKNPETNYPLEIDIYFPKHKIAIEYNGRQHYQPVDFAGKGKKWAKQKLKETQTRDKIKHKLIKQNPDKVKYFIIFSYEDKITEEHIRKTLVKKGIILE